MKHIALSLLFASASLAAEAQVSVPEVSPYTHYTGDAFTANWKARHGAEAYRLLVQHVDFDKTVEYTDLCGADGPTTLDGTTGAIETQRFAYSPAELNIAATLTNCEGITRETSSIMKVDFYDADHNYILGGQIETLFYLTAPALDLRAAIGYLPEETRYVAVSVAKADGQVGDLVVTGINYSCFDVQPVLTVDTEETSYRVEGVDPEEVYAYSVSSLASTDESERSAEVEVDGFLNPTALPASDVTSTGYTAQWTRVPKAEGYTLRNYSVATIAEGESFDVLRHDFDDITAGTIEAPKSVADFSGTSAAAWTGLKLITAQGMIGADKGSFFPVPDVAWLHTPVLNLEGADGIYTVHLRAYGTPGDYLSLYRVGYTIDGQLNIHQTLPFGSDGWLEERWTMDDGATDMVISIEEQMIRRFYVDDFSISQQAPEGGTEVTTLLSTVQIDDPQQTSHLVSYSDLAAKPTPDACYAYNVIAHRHDRYGWQQDSEVSNLQRVDAPDAVQELTVAAPSAAPRFTLTGQRATPHTSGIIISADGRKSLRR